MDLNNEEFEKDLNVEDVTRENVDEDVLEIMESQGIELEEAEEIRDLMDELGVDEDDASEIRELL